MSTVDLQVVDWTRSRRAEAEVPVDTTIGELLAEVQDALSLSRETPYHLIHQGRKLNRSETLEEIGIEPGDEFTVAPEVSAG
jgi:hypothetical protein